MIKDILVKTKVLHFKEPFQIAYEKVKTAPIVIVKITDSKNNFGLGNACPDAAVTGETISKVNKILKQKLTKDFFSLPFDCWDSYHQKIQNTFKNFPAAQAAVEEAVISLTAKIRHKTPYQLLGRPKKSVPIMITVCIKERKKTLLEVKKRLKQGYKIIKLKCGLDVEKDIKQIMAVCQILPAACKLTLDANQGYSFSEAKRLLMALKNSKVALIEQPISAKNLKGLKKLKELRCLPIIADEAVVTPKDAEKILKSNLADGVNIKLAKCGGPVNFLKIYRLAKKMKKIIMIGCMYESNISMTTGAYLAQGLNLDYVDLDTGHLDFPDDPSLGGAKVSHGKIFVSKPLTLKKF